VPAISTLGRTEWTRLASARLTGVELLAARFVRHTYARHAHDAYVLAVIDAGTQTFRYRGVQCVATAGDVVILQPGEAHDGRPLGESGYAYRTLHIATQLLAGEGGSGDLPVFPAPVLQDAPLRAAVVALCDMLEASESSKESCSEALLQTTRALTRRHARSAAAVRTEDRPADRALARQARERLEAHVSDPQFTVERLAVECGASRAHLSRVFSAQFGIPPHAWLIQRRLSRARSRLLAGEQAAVVAVDAGFADQSHFVRRFKAVYGVTPGLWVRRT